MTLPTYLFRAYFCTGRPRFGSREVAEEIVRQCNRVSMGTEYTTYTCPACAFIHITTVPEVWQAIRGAA